MGCVGVGGCRESKRIAPLPPLCVHPAGDLMRVVFSATRTPLHCCYSCTHAHTYTHRWVGEWMDGERLVGSLQLPPLTPHPKSNIPFFVNWIRVEEEWESGVCCEGETFLYTPFSTHRSTSPLTGREVVSQLPLSPFPLFFIYSVPSPPLYSTTPTVSPSHHPNCESAGARSFFSGRASGEVFYCPSTNAVPPTIYTASLAAHEWNFSETRARRGPRPLRLNRQRDLVCVGSGEGSGGKADNSNAASGAE